MNLLLLDSTKPQLLVVHARDGQIVQTKTCDEQRQHDQNINPLIAALGVTHWDAVAVVTGPGSWTGIRVGLAVAKAFAYAQNIPLIELRDQIDVAVAMQKYQSGDVVSPFAIQPFYDGEFVVKQSRKLSVNLYFNQTMDTATKLKTMRQIGYDEFFTGIYDGNETMPWAEQIQLAKRLGLGLTMVHCQYGDAALNHFWLDDEIGERVCENYLQQIRAVGPYADNFVVHLHSDFDAQTSPVGLARLQKLLAACEPFNLNLCVENLFSTTEIPYIFANLKHPLLKICYDSGHRNWLTPDFELVRDYHQFITVLHLHDNDGAADDHRILRPGSPIWQRLLTEIPLLPAGVSLAAEIKVPVGDPGQILRDNFRALEQLRKLTR